MSKVEKLLILAAIVIIPVVVISNAITEKDKLEKRLVTSTWTKDNGEELTFNVDNTGQWTQNNETIDFTWEAKPFGLAFTIETPKGTYQGTPEAGKIELNSDDKTRTFSHQL